MDVPEFPFDPELTDDERKQLRILMRFPKDPHEFSYGDMLNLQSSFLLRHRLNILTKQLDSLNRSSTRLERVTIGLLGATIILIVWTVITAIGTLFHL
jgi:hypothetical protein